MEITPRLEQERKPNENSCKSRIGDIAFSIGGKKLAGAKDDTHNPLKSPSATDPEEFVEDEKNADEEEPNSVNYMYNVREIHYTVHDMIRTLDKNDLPEATGDCVVVPDGVEKLTWDPLAEAEMMDKREGFDCYALCRRKAIPKTLLTSAPPKVIDNRNLKTQILKYGCFRKRRRGNSESGTDSASGSGKSKSKEWKKLSEMTSLPSVTTPKMLVAPFLLR